MRSTLYSLLMWLIPAAAFAKDFGPTVSNTGVSGSFIEPQNWRDAGWCYRWSINFMECFN